MGERSSSEVNSLIDAVNSAVKKAADVTAGEASTGSVMEVVNKIEKKESETENSISRVEKATEETEKAEAVSAPADVEKEEKGTEMEIKDRFGKKQDLAEVRDDAKEVPGDDMMKELSPENTTPTTSANDIKSFEHEDTHSAATTIANAEHHGHESLGGVIPNTVVGSAHAEMSAESISSDHVVDAVVANGDSPVFFEVLLASVNDVGSEFGESVMSSSDAMHGVATSTAEALTEVAAVVSSLFS